MNEFTFRPLTVFLAVAFFASIGTAGEGQPGRFVYIPDILQAGQSATLVVMVDLPREKGPFILELKPVLAWLAYGKESVWLTVNVQSDPDSNYVADITHR